MSTMVRNGSGEPKLSPAPTDETPSSSAAVVLKMAVMEPQPPLELIRNLCQKLSSEGIAYCHWKSNAMLDRSAVGDNDLDLLVGRADVHRFTDILCRLGFTRVQGPPEAQMPGVVDYYGHDPQADKWVHVHAHYQLILGHDATKNYHLPIERPYLESAVQSDLFKVPAPEFELVVFVIRMVLKHSTWDAILGRQGALSAAERQELEYLQTQVSPTWMYVYDILNQYMPLLDVTLFDDCMRSLQPNCPFGTRVKVGQRLQNRLRAHARQSRMADLGLKLWRRAAGTVRRRILGRVPRKRMADGGLMVALVGGDGAGKSTAVDELYTWLSRDFETIKVHMGKPAWSRTTVAVRGVLKIGRSLGLYPYMRGPVQPTLEADLSVFPGYPWLLRQVCTARDRYLTYAKARRFATNGGLAICDRFPLPRVMSTDGPECEQMTSPCEANRFIRFLAGLETKYYQQIMPPDLLVVLRVDPEIAVERRPDEDEASVRRRSAEVWQLDWEQIPAHVIDAHQPKAEVLAELKALVWSEL